jgi:diguanylate cyclase (GGDEF)-like protein/PAS domain S-box-containing protein
MNIRQTTGAVLLLVEDESIVAMDIKHHVESFGCTVAAWVTTGEEAIDRAGEIRPDLVLMDIALAGPMSGIEAAAVIKERYALPTLYLTANSDRATVENALVTGPIGYILKPFEKRELEVAVEMALYRSRMEKELEAALRQAELERAKSEAVVSCIGVGLCVLDTTFTILYQNRLHRELTGGDKAGTFCFNSIRNRSDICEECPLVRSYATGQVETAEREYRKGDRTLYLEITTSPITDSEGIITAGVELVKDITERKRMELALTDSEERYRKLVDYTPTGIVTLDGGVIGFVNPAGINLFGATCLDDLVGASLLDFIRPDDQELFAERLLSSEVGQQQAVEGAVLRMDGHAIDVEASFVLFASCGRNLVQVIIHDISERKRTEQVIRQMAYYDSLTGLPNRRLFDDRLHLALAQARRFTRQFAILFIDLDNFKLINDRLGHAVGDDLLKGVAGRLRDCCRRDSETVARFGGDEFIILLPELQDPAEVESLVDKLFQEFRESFAVGAYTLATNLSIGVSLYPDDGDDAKTLVMHADTALYRAKAEGRNTCRYYAEIKP